jgi:hypothetical protein
MAKPIKKENALQLFEGGQNIPIPYMDLNLFLNREIETEAALQLKMRKLKEAKALVENLQKETDEAVLKMLDRNFLSVPFWKNSFLKMLGRYYPGKAVKEFCKQQINHNTSDNKALSIICKSLFHSFSYFLFQLLRLHHPHRIRIRQNQSFQFIVDDHMEAKFQRIFV